jgi:hypothetical protein
MMEGTCMMSWQEIGIGGAPHHHLRTWDSEAAPRLIRLDITDCSRQRD